MTRKGCLLGLGTSGDCSYFPPHDFVFKMECFSCVDFNATVPSYLQAQSISIRGGKLPFGEQPNVRMCTCSPLLRCRFENVLVETYCKTPEVEKVK